MASNALPNTNANTTQPIAIGLTTHPLQAGPHRAPRKLRRAVQPLPRRQLVIGWRIVVRAGCCIGLRGSGGAGHRTGCDTGARITRGDDSSPTIIGAMIAAVAAEPFDADCSRSAYLQLFFDQCDADAEAGLTATLRSSGTSNVATMKASMIARNASA
jgi:hypothetical protein